MSNGKDFYVELRKQVTALQQGGERAGMYNPVQLNTIFRAARRVIYFFTSSLTAQKMPGRRDADSEVSIGG